VEAAVQLLRAERLTREVDGIAIVENVSLELPAGDVLAVVGPSGSGKSSLLRLLNRLDEPTQGTVFVAGADYHHIPPRDLRRRIGLVSQAAVLFPGTVADNLRFGPRQRGTEIGVPEVARLLQQVGLDGYETRDVATLSGGEAQRVALARTLANEPDVLLLDEPTSALDEAARQRVEETIVTLIRSRTLTCVVVTHDAAQAARLGRRIMVMARGRVERTGTVQEVLRA